MWRAVLALAQRPGALILAVEVKIEQEEDEGGGVAAVGSQLDDAEGGDAIRAHATELAIKIGLARINRCQGLGNRRIFMRPVEPGAGKQLARPRSSRACMRWPSYLISWSR